MTYAFSFSNDFLIGDDPELQPSLRPTLVLQAILSLSERQRIQLAPDIFGVSPDRLSAEMILDRAVATKTCENLDSPVRVWIDEAGFNTLFVHDRE
ncbi:MAG: hypothetical protein H7Z17_06430 [Fuerstia sp.]|nr:hypothetical protein [Fuerstiella sp.]